MGSMAQGWKTVGYGMVGLVLALTSACRPVADAWMTGWTGGQANDRIMLVRQEPRSLGYQRMLSQSGVYPDLEVFLERWGMPDFLAESSANHRHFLILYYQEAKTAYACRAKAPSTREIEFAGPYPMTEREYRLLRQLKAKGSGPPARQ
jgi:hypothetical protein